MTTRFSHRRKSVEAKIVGSSLRDCPETRGAEPDRFGGFSATLSHALGFPTPNRTAFETRSLALVSASAAPLRNGKFGVKIWGMKARRRHLSAMGMYRQIGTLKS